MPELPEIETICSELKPLLLNKSIEQVYVYRKQQLNIPSTKFSSHLQSQKILAVKRRAKLILIKLPQWWLITHLRMSGVLIFAKTKPTKTASSRIVYKLNSNEYLEFQDRRALGKVYLLNQAEKEKFTQPLGPEPLHASFTLKLLNKIISASNMNIKNFLLDQKKIAGIGNIYAAEILFLAKLNPLLKTSALTKQEIKKLYEAIIKVLNEAILAKGTTFSDYRRSSGQKGLFSESLYVYGREGEKCKLCKTKIKRIKQNQRGSFYCPKCQAADS